jgi:hypothetical protein
MWQFFRRARSALSRRPAPRRVRPLLDVLEDRTVPTILIQPNFPGESVISGGKTAVDATTVYLLFEGAYWHTPQGQTDQGQLTKDVKNLLDRGNPYLNGLSQYTASGNNVQAGFGTSFEDKNALPANFAPLDPNTKNLDWTTLNARLQSAINDPTSLIPGSGTPTPTYILVTDPNVSSGSTWTGTNDSGADVGFRRLVYVRTQIAGAGVDVDACTEILSHELVESLSGSVQVQQSSQFAKTSGTQIADGEPNTFSPSGKEYAFPVNGILVQAYWSDRDQAFLVPDGSAQTTTLAPVWQGTTFTGQFNTVIPTSAGGAGSHHAADDTGQSTGTTGGGTGSEVEPPGGSQHHRRRGHEPRGHHQPRHGHRHGHRRRDGHRDVGR